MGNAQDTSGMSGPELRKLRRAHRWSQRTFAALVGVRQGRLSTIERQQTVPATVAAMARALSLAKNAELKALTSPRLVPWRESSKFSQKPRFESLPKNGIACRCGRSDCQLSPEMDGDWLNGHLWKFHGTTCGHHVFLNSSGMMVTPARPRRWHQSKAFKLQPPFGDLPSPCPMCANAKCDRPKPVRDITRDGQHLWVFQGVDCNRSYCLNAEGKFVGAAPLRNAARRPTELRKPCSQCGRLREIQKDFRANLGCEVITLRCRTRQADLVSGRKHDPIELFREENGTFRPLTTQELDLLHDRNRYSFPVPHCEEENCPGLGCRMESSGVRLGEIVAFVCRRSKPRHYAFRHAPGGEIVTKLADGWYQWRDAQSGQVREKKSVPGGPLERHPRRHPSAPIMFCPDHPANQLRRSHGLWRDHKTRKLRWQYHPCSADSADHPGWTCSEDEIPRRVVSRPKRRWAGERRAPSQAKLAAAKRKYEALKRELKAIHDFVRSMRTLRTSTGEKLRLAEQRMQNGRWERLGHYWQRLTTDLAEALINPQAWTPAEKAKEFLAPEIGYTVSSFSRFVVEESRSR